MTSSTCGIARYTGATQGSAPTASRSPRARSRRSSGSVITASPIHCGAMTSERVKVVMPDLIRHPCWRANDLDCGSSPQ